jgi:hypothetical protein
MVDQNGGGYMAPTGQSQAAASAAGYGTNSNIPLLQTPQQQQQQATTTSTATASGASLNSPAAAGPFTAAGNSRQQAQQSYSNHHALIHQSQAFYPTAATSSQHPSAPHNQVSRRSKWMLLNTHLKKKHRFSIRSFFDTVFEVKYQNTSNYRSSQDQKYQYDLFLRRL